MGTNTFMVCCGKMFCSGCFWGNVIGKHNGICPFCRTQQLSPKEDVERLKKRVEANDAESFVALGGAYRAADLRSIEGPHNTGITFTMLEALLGMSKKLYIIGKLRLLEGLPEQDMHWDSTKLA
jgi:hypothetical protein